MVQQNNDADLSTYHERLIADLLAITLRMDGLVKTDRSLTALQRECLINAIGNLNTFFSVSKRS